MDANTVSLSSSLIVIVLVESFIKITSRNKNSSHEQTVK